MTGDDRRRVTREPYQRYPAVNGNHLTPNRHADTHAWVYDGVYRPCPGCRDAGRAGQRDGNADLYRQAARYIRRPAPKRDPWLTAAVIAWATGSAIAVILAAEQNTPWWLTALIPATVLVTIGLVRAMDR